MQIRNSAKALIVRDGSLLTIRMRDEFGPYFILPSGGQQPEETLVDALRRECSEEIGVEVTVHELLFVRDFISRNHPRPASHPPEHRVEFFFHCSIGPGMEPCGGSHPDDGQDGLAWFPLSQLPDVRFYPRGLGPLLSHGGEGDRVSYLGDFA